MSVEDLGAISLRDACRLAVREALKAGTLVRAAHCSECNAPDRKADGAPRSTIHGHHDDYTKPLDVRWLCARCHMQVHAPAVSHGLRRSNVARRGAVWVEPRHIDEARLMYGAGRSLRAIGRALGVHHGTVGRAIAAVAVALVVMTASGARAQSDETLLLRTCISERGFRTDVDDCVVVAEVVRARMERRGETFGDALRALAPRLHGGCRVSRPWLCDLDVDCHRPAGWPRSASWARRQAACEATVAEVRAILAGERVSPCTERPAHWGSRSDVARRVAAGFRWRDAACPGAVLLNRAGFLYRRRDVDAE